MTYFNIWCVLVYTCACHYTCIIPICHFIFYISVLILVLMYTLYICVYACVCVDKCVGLWLCTDCKFGESQTICDQWGHNHGILCIRSRRTSDSLGNIPSSAILRTEYNCYFSLSLLLYVKPILMRLFCISVKPCPELFVSLYLLLYTNEFSFFYIVSVTFFKK